MAAKKGGLGKGFDSLFLDNSSDALSEGGSVMLPIGDIEPDRGQPRTKFSEEALSELEASIREFGVLQPLLVRQLRGYAAKGGRGPCPHGGERRLPVRQPAQLPVRAGQRHHIGLPARLQGRGQRQAADEAG